MRRGRMKGVWGGAIALIAATMLGAHVSAEICDVAVYDSLGGKRLKPADTVFNAGEEFILCVAVRADGYVSLWDRMPKDGPVERLAPGPYSKNPKARAVAAKAGETLCFGDGTDGYLLRMDPADGTGLGRMWLVYSSTLASHPKEDVFKSIDIFRDAYYAATFGAGAMEDEAAGRKGATAQCVAKGALNYYYRVTPR
ncbi:MAG: DUF4384 domain-containing protein [Neomegalonema sp.]|nr:DUF4384 domain-containing protein [Neomegalonema sp.]